MFADAAFGGRVALRLGAIVAKSLRLTRIQRGRNCLELRTALDGADVRMEYRETTLSMQEYRLPDTSLCQKICRRESDGIEKDSSASARRRVAFSDPIHDASGPRIGELQIDCRLAKHPCQLSFLP